MVDSTDDDAPMRALEGWGTPPARAGFVDDVLARTDGERAARRRAWLLPFALGSVAGGVIVGVAFALHREPPAPRAAEGIHLQVPGIVELVGEPGAEVRWDRTADGRVVVDVIAGVAWIRTLDPGLLELRADDEPELIGGECGRIAVERGVFSVDKSVDQVECAAVERAELSARRSR